MYGLYSQAQLAKAITEKGHGVDNMMPQLLTDEMEQ